MWWIIGESGIETLVVSPDSYVMARLLPCAELLAFVSISICTEGGFFGLKSMCTQDLSHYLLWIGNSFPYIFTLLNLLLQSL